MPGYYETRYALATAHTRLGHTEEAARQLDMFERARRAALEQSRRDFASEAEREERRAMHDKLDEIARRLADAQTPSE